MYGYKLEYQIKTNRWMFAAGKIICMHAVIRLNSIGLIFHNYLGRSYINIFSSNPHCYKGSSISRQNLNKNLETLHLAPTLIYHLPGFYHGRILIFKGSGLWSKRMSL